MIYIALHIKKIDCKTILKNKLEWRNEKKMWFISDNTTIGVPNYRHTHTCCVVVWVKHCVMFEIKIKILQKPVQFKLKHWCEKRSNEDKITRPLPASIFCLFFIRSKWKTVSSCYLLFGYAELVEMQHGWPIFSNQTIYKNGRS